MGEALIVRRGGGGGAGDFSLEEVETIWGASTSSALDENATYILSLGAGLYADDMVYTDGGVYILKSGVITTVYQGDFSRVPVSYDASTKKIKLRSASNDYVQTSWDEMYLIICKVN